MIVLPYPQSFTETPTRKEHKSYVSETVSQNELNSKGKVKKLELLRGLKLYYQYFGHLKFRISKDFVKHLTIKFCDKML